MGCAPPEESVGEKKGTATQAIGQTRKTKKAGGEVAKELIHTP